MAPITTFTEANRRRKLLGFLRGRIRLARLSLGVESFLQAFWPVLTLLGFAYGALAFGAFAALPTSWAMPIMAAVGGLLLVLLARAVRQFVWPTQSQALERMDENLESRPIASLQDSPAINTKDPFAQALWAAHIAEMNAHAKAARAPFPAPDLPKYDQYGLRLMALSAVLLALIFAPKIGVEALRPPTGDIASTTAPRVAIEAWATPPAYTGKPAIFLTELEAGARISLPIGSEITLRTYGDGVFSLTENVSGEAAALLVPEEGEPARDGHFAVRSNGTVEIFDGQTTLGQWRISVIADEPPTIAAPDGIGKSHEGALSVAYAATDDYGIVSTRYIIHPELDQVVRAYGLVPAPVAVPQDFIGELPLPFTQDLTDIKETLLADFSKEMWANLPISLTLEVTDGAGQVARVALSSDELPALSFFDQLAAAVVEQRRDLMWSPENDRRVSQVLRAVSYRPEDGLFPNASSYLLLRSAIRRMGYQMEDGLDETERAALEELLWQIALKIENGDLSGAEARLRRAQDRLSQALENGATSDEIAGLMDELREATKDYMRELAQNMDPDQQQAQGETRTITSDQLQEMLDRIQELSEQGRTEEAQQLLEELQDFMNNMQMVQGAGGGQQQNAEQQQMQDGLQQQQELSDEAFQQLQEQFGEQGQGNEEGQNLADRQEQLREFVEQMQEDGAGGAALGEAERNMGEARDRLRQGDFSGAFDAQAQALENMRETMREMENRQADGRAGQDGNIAAEQNQYDPLGRPLGNKGRADGDTAVPDQNASDRARALLGEIRRRTGEAARPAEELDYLNRLLDRF